MNNDAYIIYINDLCNKVIKNNSNIVFNSKTKKFTTTVKYNENFNDLSDDDRYNVEHALKKHFTNLIMELKDPFDYKV